MKHAILTAAFLVFAASSPALAQQNGSSDVCDDIDCDEDYDEPAPPRTAPAAPAPAPVPTPRANPAPAPVAPAQRDGACTVTDPTGTPLNVRAKPQGAVVATLPNGVKVRVVAMSNDHKGQPWAYVAIGEGNLGWVIRRFITCN